VRSGLLGRGCLLAVCCLLVGRGVIAQDGEPRAMRVEAMPGITDAYYTSFDDDNPYATAEMLDHIRREKFDLVLPRVMRSRGVDMWIHVIRPWTWSGNEQRQLEGLDLNYQSIDSVDPLRYEFGSNAAVLVFTDRGGDGIERAVFEGEVEDVGAYDIVNGQSKFINQENYEVMDFAQAHPDRVPGSETGYRFMGLGAISYADHFRLSEELGAKYAERMISAEYMILDYLNSNVMAEIVLFGGSGRPRNFRSLDGIVPGETRLSDVHAGWFCTREAGHDEEAMADAPLHRGDMFQIGQVPYYLLRDGESEPPPEIQRSWNDVVRVREILRENIVPGPTAGETLDLVVRKLEEAGFAYIDRDVFDATLDPGKPQVHLDLHAVGKGVLAPRISPLGPKWHWNMKIPLLLTLGVEYMVHSPTPERGPGHHVYYCSLHERGVVTERGIEFAAPPVSGIRSVR